MENNPVFSVNTFNTQLDLIGKLKWIRKVTKNNRTVGATNRQN